MGDAKSSARVLPCACLFVRSFVLPLLDTLFLPAPRRETRFTAFVTGSPSDNHKMITSGRGTATLHNNLCYTAISHCGTELLTSASCNVFFTLFHCCSVCLSVCLDGRLPPDPSPASPPDLFLCLLPLGRRRITHCFAAVAFLPTPHISPFGLARGGREWQLALRPAGLSARFSPLLSLSFLVLCAAGHGLRSPTPTGPPPVPSPLPRGRTTGFLAAAARL